MNFNRNLIIGLIVITILQNKLSQSMEEQILDEATLNELNEAFLKEQEKYNEKLDFRAVRHLLLVSKTIKSIFYNQNMAQLNHQYDFNPLQDTQNPQPMWSNGGEKLLSFPDSHDYQRTPFDISWSLKQAFYDAIYNGDLERIEMLISMKIDLDSIIGEEIPLIIAIHRAGYSLEQNEPDKETKLKIVELILQHGANVNQKGLLGQTPLEETMVANFPKIQIIKLLLGYGANITEQSLKTAKSQNTEKIMQILDLHTRLLNQVQNNPTEELLRLTIFFNKPYVVQLIVNNKPELVTLNHIKLARATSPASLACLTKAFRLYKFREFLIENRLPLELILPIEELVEKNI